MTTKLFRAKCRDGRDFDSAMQEKYKEREVAELDRNVNYSRVLYDLNGLGVFVVSQSSGANIWVTGEDASKIGRVKRDIINTTGIEVHGDRQARKYSRLPQ